MLCAYVRMYVHTQQIFTHTYSTTQIKLDTHMCVSCESSKLNKDNMRVGYECTNMTHEPVTLNTRVGIHRMLNHLIGPHASSWSRVANM